MKGAEEGGAESGAKGKKATREEISGNERELRRRRNIG
jgi:hypothetical protein